MVFNEIIELGKRAVASEHWIWMDGMKVHLGVHTDWIRLRESDKWHVPPYRPSWIPDFADYSTLGCLLAIVLKAHSADMACFSIMTDIAPQMSGPDWRWQICDYRKRLLAAGKFSVKSVELAYASALVAALSAAPSNK